MDSGVADLADRPLVHHGDPVAQAHGLGLVVGDIDRGHLDLPLEELSSSRAVCRTLASKFDSGSSIRSTFGRRTTPGRWRRADARRPRSARACGRAGGRCPAARPPTPPSSASRPSASSRPRAERRCSRRPTCAGRGVALEHHGDAPLARRQIVHLRAVDDDAPAGRAFEASDEPHERGLAAPDGPRSARNSPSAISRSMPSTAFTPSKCFLIPMSCTFAMVWLMMSRESDHYPRGTENTERPLTTQQSVEK